MKFHKIRTTVSLMLTVIVLSITGCAGSDNDAALNNRLLQSLSESEASTWQLTTQETTTAQLTQETTQQLTQGAAAQQSAAEEADETQEAVQLSEDDLLVDASRLEIPEYSGTDFYIVNDNVPFFSENLQNYSGNNFIYLSELDELGRCGTCIGMFTNSTLPTEERGEIGHIKPSGWHTAKYDKSVIPDLYLYNRCHLLMYAVSGINDDTRNLITGTRQMNLDMLELENQVLDTLKYDENARMLYRVTPVFDGDDLVAKGVLMEALNIADDKGLSFCMFIYNVQDGIVIDYATGDNELADEAVNTAVENTVTESGSDTGNEIDIQNGTDASSEIETTQEITTQAETTKQAVDTTTQSGTDYVANTNTKKFHYTWCASVNRMKSENRLDYTGTREELINMGYEPCKKCNP